MSPRCSSAAASGKQLPRCLRARLRPLVRRVVFPEYRTSKLTSSARRVLSSKTPYAFGWNNPNMYFNDRVKYNIQVQISYSRTVITPSVTAVFGR